MVVASLVFKRGSCSRLTADCLTRFFCQRFAAGLDVLDTGRLAVSLALSLDDEQLHRRRSGESQFNATLSCNPC